MRREKRMSEADRAIVRACLEQVLVGMVEARGVLTWWSQLGEKNRAEWKDFWALAEAKYNELRR
jgi:hypothetical protein